MNKPFRNILVFAILFTAAFLIARMGNKNGETVKREQIILGTVVEIQVRNADDDIADKAITAAFNEVKRIDKLFTTYDEKSPVNLINRSDDSILAGIDSEIYNLLLMCDSISKVTGNAFDVSIHELITAWGFETDTPAVPHEENIVQALEYSGWDNVDIEDNSIIRGKHIKFNFGAIAKGYAVDRAIEVLKKNGIKEALVNAGGEVKSLGTGWRIGIQHPRDNELIARLILNDYSAATSGDYEQYFEENGTRYHHILDPGTGFPAYGCRSVTVIAPDNFTADALATGIFVAGREEGLRIAEQLPLIEVLIVDSNGEIFMSPGFNKYLVKAD